MPPIIVIHMYTNRGMALFFTKISLMLNVLVISCYNLISTGILIVIAMSPSIMTMPLRKANRAEAFLSSLSTDLKIIAKKQAKFNSTHYLLIHEATKDITGLKIRKL